MKMDLKALSKSMMLTGSLLLGLVVGSLLVKYANPVVAMIFLLLILIVFFYVILKD